MRKIPGVLTFIICLPLIGTMFVKPDRDIRKKTQNDTGVINAVNEGFNIRTKEDTGSFIYKPEEFTMLLMYRLIPENIEFSSSEDYIAENDEAHDPEQEYLKALSIVCRTDIIYMWENEGCPDMLDFDIMGLDMTNFSKIYAQSISDTNNKIKLNEIKRAVNATRGAVITDEEKVIKAPFFTSSEADMLVGEAGDGVGFSLNYAYELAARGNDFYEILKHFYENIKLNIYE